MALFQISVPTPSKSEGANGANIKKQTNPFLISTDDQEEEEEPLNDKVPLGISFDCYLASPSEEEKKGVEEGSSSFEFGTEFSSASPNISIGDDFCDSFQSNQQTSVDQSHSDWVFGIDKPKTSPSQVEHLDLSQTESIENDNDLVGEEKDEYYEEPKYGSLVDSYPSKFEQNNFFNSLAFDTRSYGSLEYFLEQYHTKSNSVIATESKKQKQNLKKSNSTASFFLSTTPTRNETSPTVANNHNSNTINMNLASRKRNLFGRSSKSSAANNSHTASSTSINDTPLHNHHNHNEENGKLKTHSSPSGTSHHINELDEERFNGDGVMFQGKMIGHEYVAEARGEQMCQQSLKKLKIIQKALGGHKRKINMFISYDGIKIFDTNTNEELFHHTVPQISFISRDETDIRAFGYVFGNSQTGHQFIGIKTKKDAMVVMSTIGQLFAITLKRKRSAEQQQTQAEKKEAHSSSSILATISQIFPDDEHLYHSVGEQPQQESELALGASKSTLRSRLRHQTGVPLDNIPIPALPPPTDQPRHRIGQAGANRFATISSSTRLQDINNNNFQSKAQTTGSSLINELDLYQQQQQQQQDQKSTSFGGVGGGGVSYEWANFDDDVVAQPTTIDDSTLNTISSISDTFQNHNNNSVTLNESVTLVAQQQPQHQLQQLPQTNNFPTQFSTPKSKPNLHSSSTTISSANFDGMDPFSDAFGASGLDDPFSTTSTTADISSNIFNSKVTNTNILQQQNRPPSNPGPQTMFDSNRFQSFNKNAEMNSGSVPFLAQSLGSLSLDRPGGGPSNSFMKSNAELSRSQNSADKYAVLHDINAISTSVFDSLGGQRQDNNYKENELNRPPSTSSNTPPPSIGQQQQPQRRFQIGYHSQQQQQQQQSINPIPYAVNGVVVLPPITSTTSSSVMKNNSQQWSHQQSQPQQDFVPRSTYCQQTFGGTPGMGGIMGGSGSMASTAPMAEFESMSNLSSTSSSSTNTNQTTNRFITQQQQLAEQQKPCDNNNNIPAFFEELDPLNKNKSSSSNFINNDTNRSQTLMANTIGITTATTSINNPLDSSITRVSSTMNPSNQSPLFNNTTRNCSTPNSSSSLKQASMIMTSNRKTATPLISQNSLPSTAKFNLTQQAPTTTMTTSMASMKGSFNNFQNKPNPNYIMLYNLNTGSVPMVDDPSLTSMKTQNDDDIRKVESTTSKFDQMESSQQQQSTMVETSIKDVDAKKQTEEMENDHHEDDTNEKLTENQSIKEPLTLAVSNENTSSNLTNKHSASSSISSSSNSLLLMNQSNFSELKFDDIFEQPLLDVDRTQNDDKSSPSQFSVEGQKESLSDDKFEKKNNENTAPIKSSTSTNQTITSNTAAVGQQRSLSRQSSTSSQTSTPPAIPPRTDLPNQHQHGQHSSTKYHHQIAPPPIPLPHSNHFYHAHHSPYRHMVAPPPPPPHPYHHQPPPYYSSYYPYGPPPPHGDLYADPMTLRRPNSSHHQHHHTPPPPPPPPSHHRYWNSAYDWYGSMNHENETPPPILPHPHHFGSSPRPLDYPPTMPPPPIPNSAASASSGSNNFGQFSTTPPNVSMDYYAHTSRQFNPPMMTADNVAVASTTATTLANNNCQLKAHHRTNSSWHEHYQNTNSTTQETVVEPPSHTNIQQQPSHSSSLTGASSATATNADAEAVSSTLADGGGVISNATVCSQPKRESNQLNSSTPSTAETTPTVPRATASTETTTSGRKQQPSASITPPLPNPQRRISSCSTLSIDQSHLHRTPSMISTISSSSHSPSLSSMSNPPIVIPTYPPPPPPHSHHQDTPPYYAYYEDSVNNKEFMAFNLGMEQMIMKYHRNSPLIMYDYAAIPPYGPPPFPYPSYPSYANTNVMGHAGSRSARNSYAMMEATIDQPSSSAAVNYLGSSNNINNINSNNHSNNNGGSLSLYQGQPQSNFRVEDKNGLIISNRTNNSSSTDAWLTQQPAQSSSTSSSCSGLKQHLQQQSMINDPQLQPSRLFDDDFANFDMMTDPSSTNQELLMEQKEPNNDDYKDDKDDKNEQNNANTSNIKNPSNRNQHEIEQNIVETKLAEIPETNDNNNKEKEQPEESPEERNIFIAQEDPFEDEFFKSS